MTVNTPPDRSSQHGFEGAVIEWGGVLLVTCQKSLGRSRLLDPKCRAESPATSGGSLPRG